MSASSLEALLQLDHHQRHPVDEHHQIRPLLHAVFNDGELVENQPVVIFRRLEVDRPHLFRLVAAVLPLYLHVDAVGQHLMKRLVVDEQMGTLGNSDLPHRLLDRFRRQVEVDAGQRLPQPFFQYHLGVVLPFRIVSFRGKFGSVLGLIAELLKPLEGGLFQILFTIEGHSDCLLSRFFF